MFRAEAGIKELKDNVDTLIVINNQNLLSSESVRKKPFLETFQLVNNVLYDGIKSVTYPIVRVWFFFLKLSSYINPSARSCQYRLC